MEPIGRTSIEALAAAASNMMGTPESPFLRARLRLLWVVLHSPDLSTGVYDDDLSPHAGGPAAPATVLATWLQGAYSLTNLDFAICSAVALLFAQADRTIERFGARGFRMINMEAGALVHRLAVEADGRALGVHPLFGLEEAPIVDRLPRMGAESHFVLGVAFGGRPRESDRLPLPLWI